MGERALEKMLAGLDAAFEAAAARQDDVAASDLALSFLQGRSLADVLRTSGPLDLVLGDGIALAVSMLGRDYAAAGDPPLVAPLRRAALVARSAGRRPELRSNTMLELLRSWARNGTHAVVTTAVGRFTGRLAHAGPDHVAVWGVAGPVLVGWDGICNVRVSPRG